MAAWLATGWLALAPGSVALGQTAASPIRVRTYNTFGLSAAEWAVATGQASALLGHAGVTVTWRDCRTNRGPSAASLPCDDVPVRGELIVRVTVATRLSPPAETLGEAHVDAAGRGALATLFGDRIDRVAMSAGMRRAVLAGRVLAHEIGHLLIGTAAHSTQGLMRGEWPVGRLRLDAADDWRFDAADAERIRLGAAARLRADLAPTPEAAPGWR